MKSNESTYPGFHLSAEFEATCLPLFVSPPVDISERRLQRRLYQRFRICGVDSNAQTVQLYFLDEFTNLSSAMREVSEVHQNESLGTNLAVQTRSFIELLANATWLSHDDVLHSKRRWGVTHQPRRVSFGY